MNNWVTSVNSVINTIGTNISSVWTSIKGPKVPASGSGGGIVNATQPVQNNTTNLLLFAALGLLGFILIRGTR